jgi:hypothetical protein
MKNFLVAAACLVASCGSVRAVESNVPLPGNYCGQDEHNLHLDADGSYQFDRALLCELIKKGKPNNYFVSDRTFRCQGHPYPNIKPQYSIEKEKWYATTIEGKMVLTIVSNGGNSIETYLYEGEKVQCD